MVSILLNVYAHLQRNYDYLLVVVGDTGVGKSMWVLHLLETWYRVVLGRELDDSLVDNVCISYRSWVENFQRLGRFDLNVFDEGSTALDSKDAMSKLSRDLAMLFNVVRVKGVFSVVVLPSFFHLNKYFRENRLRGVVWIDRRGRYSFFSKVGVKFLNVYNASRRYKSMGVARPIHRGVFPDYSGVFRSVYDSKKDLGVSEVLDGVISGLDEAVIRRSRVEDLIVDDVRRLLGEGLSQRVIAVRLKTSQSTINKVVQKIRLRDKGKG